MARLSEGQVKIELREKGEAVKVGRHFGQPRTVSLNSYNVIGPDNSLVGVVRLDMATFETRSKGRTYVNSRWRSPRWFYRVGTGYGRSRSFYDTRKQAVEALLREAGRLALKGEPDE